MKLGEIKLEALKLMFCNGDEDIAAEDLEKLMDADAYGAFLINMWGSINRCFADFENKGVLPLRCMIVDPSLGETGLCGIRFNLMALCPDFLAIERVIHEEIEGGYNGHGAYRMEGDTLVLPPIDKETEEYRLLYHPRLQRLRPYDPDTTEIPIPDHIAAYIPYFIKSELYREDEPSEAAEARNFYEAGMSELAQNNTHSANRVENIYRQEV